MKKGFYKSYVGPLQFAFLALLYAVPLLTGHHIQPVALDALTNILEFEFGVIIYGGLIVGVFFIPIALVDSKWLRLVSLVLIVLLGFPVADRFLGEYGWNGLFLFIWLSFVTYGGAFLSGISFSERRKILTEIGLRWVFYFVLFALLAALVKNSSNVYYWRDAGTVLWFGLIYFSVSAVLEYKRYFPRAANICLHILNNKYVLKPKSRIRYNKGKIKAYLLKRNYIHQWPLLLLTGAATTTISAAVVYGTLNMESWVGIIALWVFMLPFLLLGLALFLTALVYAYWAVKAEPLLLQFHRLELQESNKLLAKGFIPRYSNKEERKNVGVELVCYQVIQVEKDIVAVEKLIGLRTPDRDFEYRMADNGTTYQVECRIPFQEVQDHGTGGPDMWHVWHLQMDITEKLSWRGESKHSYSWQMAFPLPVNH